MRLNEFEDLLFSGGKPTLAQKKVIQLSNMLDKLHAQHSKIKDDIDSYDHSDFSGGGRSDLKRGATTKVTKLQNRIQTYNDELSKAVQMISMEEFNDIKAMDGSTYDEFE